LQCITKGGKPRVSGTGLRGRKMGEGKEGVTGKEHWKAEGEVRW
jgi:hypothetical protein